MVTGIESGSSGGQPPDQPQARYERSADWLVGGGELGDLIRSTDWSRTPPGPREDWPQSLRTTVALVVASSFPMALLWGPELLLLYNDAYRDIAGDKHPGALGRSTREVWAEVWHVNEPIFDAVMQRGETLHFKDKPFRIHRLGSWEEARFTLCYSPVYVEDGSIGGTLVILEDTTERVRSEQALRQTTAERERADELIRESEARHAFLLNLSDALHAIQDPVDQQQIACRMLGQLLNADRVLYGEHHAEEGYVLILPDYHREGLHSGEGRRPLDEFTDLLALPHSGRAVSVADTETAPELSERVRYACHLRGIRAFVIVNLVNEGKPTWTLAVVSGTPRSWTPHELALVEETGSRTWAAVERARRGRAAQGQPAARRGRSKEDSVSRVAVPRAQKPPRSHHQQPLHSGSFAARWRAGATGQGRHCTTGRPVVGACRRAA